MSVLSSVWKLFFANCCRSCFEVQELLTTACSAKASTGCQDRDEMEEDYKASVDELQQLLESKIALYQQQLSAMTECLQSGFQFHAPEHHQQQLVTCDVSSVTEAINRSAVELAKCQHVLRAFRITADASLAYRKALKKEKQLLEELPAPWQQCIDDSSVLIQCTTQRLQRRFLEAEQNHAEAHIRSAHAYHIFMLVFCRAHLLWPLGDAIGLLFSSPSSQSIQQAMLFHTARLVCAEMSSVRFKR